MHTPSRRFTRPFRPAPFLGFGAESLSLVHMSDDVRFRFENHAPRESKI